MVEGINEPLLQGGEQLKLPLQHSHALLYFLLFSYTEPLMDHPQLEE